MKINLNGLLRSLGLLQGMTLLELQKRSINRKVLWVFRNRKPSSENQPVSIQTEEINVYMFNEYIQYYLPCCFVSLWELYSNDFCPHTYAKCETNVT